MKNLKREKLYIQVLNEIKKYILTNNLKQGDKLPTELELSEMLGVSRNVIREAIKSLDLIGVIKSAPGIGMIVQEYNLDFIYENIFYNLVVDDKKLINEILQIRAILELGLAKDAFDCIGEKEIKLLDNILANQETGNFEDNDKEFHEVLYKNLNNKTFNSILQAAWTVDRNINPKSDQYTHKDLLSIHSGIVEALREKDYANFYKAMKAHFTSGIYLGNRE